MLSLLPCILFSSIVLATAATPNYNISTDQFALLTLKAHIIDDPTNLLFNNWSASSSVCNWVGVTCGIRHHRVTALNISDFGLTGIIPPQLGNLSFLTKITIRNNSFHGSVPHELAQLNRLKYIDFGFNNFNKEKIPSWFGSLPKLQHLSLRGNSFTGTINSLSLGNVSSVLQKLDLRENQLSGTIPSSIFNNISSSLEIVYLSNNQLSGSFPSICVNMSSLLSVDFSHNRLSGGLPKDVFNHLPNLKFLYLSSNTFEGDIDVPLMTLSKHSKHLQTLDLSVNHFRGVIRKEIGNLTKLKELYLGINKLQGEVPEELGDLAELERLSLSGNELTGSIPSLIFNLSSLISLGLSNNSLTGSLPPHNMCQHLPHLRGLDLSNNKLSGQIPNNLWQCRELGFVSLKINQFTGSIPRDIGNLTMIDIIELSENKLIGEIPNEISNLLNLEYLVLEFNKLVGLVPASIFNISTIIQLSLSGNKFYGSLPSTIGLGLPNLEELYLSSNNFSGKIPNSITNASKLSILEMSYNCFSGFVPDTLGDLRSLTWLNLLGNHLTSPTPAMSFLSSLRNCQELTVLSLSENPLNGILPSSIGNLSVSLGIINMTDCNISGSIPEGIGNLNNLTVLELGNNEMSGAVPITLGRLQKLQGLTLRNNKLEGSIPDDLCHLNQLVELYLDGNKLSGSIPPCLGNLSALQYLFLGSNRLTSIIPSMLWNLKGILHFNLSSNSLHGTLPLDIGNLKVATEIDLSRNILSGEIPTSTGDLKDLHILNLSHNRLQGSIPETFGDMLSFEYLSLSYNNLSGIIPKSMETLLYLKFVDMSFNRLEGEIPTKGSFANFSAESFMGNHALCGLPQLQVPPCIIISAHRKSKTTILVIILLPTMSVALIIILSFLFVFKRFKRRTKRPTDAEMSPHATWRRISYLDLIKATDGWNESNLLGTGGFGSVYKGLLQDGTKIAVKVLHMQLEGAIKSFDVECEVLSSIRHRNLVKIISSCTNDDFRALILEYMPNGSLEMCLYSHSYFLDILQRLDIMIDVASALEYLHFGNSIPIVHCDVKPSNVLMDDDMVAHLSDFGIAKLFGEEESMTQTQTLATIGYMAPEYGREGKVSRKGDVYSYGIMLIETFTRKKPTDDIFVGEMSLRRWVDDLLRDDSIIEVADTNLLKREDRHFRAKKQCVSSVLHLAMDCTTDIPEHRINMMSAVSRLVKIRVTLVAKTRWV